MGYLCTFQMFPHSWIGFHPAPPPGNYLSHLPTPTSVFHHPPIYFLSLPSNSPTLGGGGSIEPSEDQGPLLFSFFPSLPFPSLPFPSLLLFSLLLLLLLLLLLPTYFVNGLSFLMLYMMEELNLGKKVLSHYLVTSILDVHAKYQVSHPVL
jgi:hypothetical protein